MGFRTSITLDFTSRTAIHSFVPWLSVARARVFAWRVCLAWRVCYAWLASSWLAVAVIGTRLAPRMLHS